MFKNMRMAAGSKIAWNDAAADPGRHHFQCCGRTLCEKQGFRIKAVYPECLADHLIHGRFFIHHGKGFIPDKIWIQLRIGAFLSWDSLATGRMQAGNGKEDFFLSQRNIKILRLLFF